MEGINNNNTNERGILKNIRSNFILKKIFNNLNQTILLNMIRYNKELKNRLDKNINHYIKEHSKIRIELIPMEFESGKFINIPKEYKHYFHIYFNDKKVEVKRNYIKENDEISKIKIEIDNEVKSLSKLFEDCQCIKIINFTKLDIQDIEDMSYMFNRCWSLKKINFTKFKTNNVINMSYMFSECSELKEIDFTKFNTNKVINMSYMFNRCPSLKELDLSNFNTNNVLDMSHMFYICSSLEKINISNFNTSNTNNLSYMFYGCSSLKELDISNFSTKDSANIRNLFDNCFNFNFNCADEFKEKFKKIYPHLFN